ncbi:hypothetical protein LCGC14_1853520, partial [marine sediment metagenome]
DWCKEAAKRWGDEDLRDGPLALGVDVADSPTGDQSAIARWQGACCTEVVPFHAADASEVGRIVYREINDSDNPVNPRHVGIDAVGVGASTVNELKRLGVRVRILSGATRPVPQIDTEVLWSKTDKSDDGTPRPTGPRIVEAERYANQRSQVLWRLREDLRLNRIALPDDKKLFEELTAIEYEEPGGKITIAPKKLIKIALGRSPDRADAVAYGNWVRPRRPLRQAKKEEPKANRNVDRGLEKLLARSQKRIAAEQRRMKRFLKGLERKR